MKKPITYFIILSFLIGIMPSCQQNEQQEKEVKIANNDYLLMSTLFQQKAAERRALSYQAFNIARLMLDNELKKSGLTKKDAEKD